MPPADRNNWSCCTPRKSCKKISQGPKCWNCKSWKSIWTKAACTEAAPPWSKASFGNREARVFLLKLLLEIGELLAQGFEFPSEFRNFRFQLLDSLSIHR